MFASVSFGARACATRTRQTTKFKVAFSSIVTRPARIVRPFTTLPVEAADGIDDSSIDTTSNNHHNRNLSNGNAQLVVSILGPPNAGKSTLFNKLMCKQTNRTYKLSSEKGNRTRKGSGPSKGRVGSKSPKNNKIMVGGAIVSPVPGTTRDRRECIGRIGGTTFRLVDTAGVDGERIGHLFDPKGKNPLEQQMMQQTLEAATASDLVLLMIDARVGVTYDLTETARWLRKISNNHDDNHARADNINSQETSKRTRKILLLANKLEGDAWSYDGSPVLQYLSDASRIGYGEAIPISAEHGEGLADIAAVIEELKAKKRERLGLPIQDYRDDEIENTVNDGQEKPLQLAILGRQNVGKSTLVNALLKQQRVLSGATPGLTRDSIAIEWSWQGRPVKLVDTAGIRKATQRDSSNVIEDLAVRDAMRAMKIADVAVLVLDAETRSLQRQELAIADAIIKEGRSIVVVANKMDLLVDNAEGGYTKEEYTQAVRDHLETRLPVLRNTPVVAMCSLTGECVDDLMPLVFHARDRWSRKIPTGTLNRWVADVTQSHAPPMQNGRPARIKYVMQTKGRPPTFLLFCNVAQLPVSYLRYLTRNFQDTFQMFGMEVRIAIKKASASNPFGGDSKKGGRAGRGVGGWKGRQKRLLKELKTHGAPLKHGRKPRRKTE